MDTVEEKREQSKKERLPNKVSFHCRAERGRDEIYSSELNSLGNGHRPVLGLLPGLIGGIKRLRRRDGTCGSGVARATALELHVSRAGSGERREAVGF